jgi:hypothetical protein
LMDSLLSILGTEEQALMNRIIKMIILFFI